MKLSDIDLTEAQVAAFLRRLDRDVRKEALRLAKEQEEESKAAVYEARFGKLIGLAREWARKYGKLEGLPSMYMAEATWNAFTSGDAWFSEMDVDHYFEGDADWQEAWETAYIDAVEGVAR